MENVGWFGENKPPEHQMLILKCPFCMSESAKHWTVYTSEPTLILNPASANLKATPHKLPTLELSASASF